MSIQDEKLPFKIWQASKSFKKIRADYYNYLASILRSSGGTIKFLQLFENDIVRFDQKPRGILCAFWHERYSTNGGNLADAFQGTLPDDEVAIIRVAQDAGADALNVAMEDIARTSKLTDRIAKESMGTVLAGLIGVFIAFMMLTAFPVFSVAELKHAYEFLPLEAWGPKGKRYHAYAEFVKAYYLHIGVVIGLVGSTFYWSLGNYVGEGREWLDEHLSIYRVSRDLRGALFLATMSTLTKKRGGVMFTLKQSLEVFMESARTPWMRWRLGQIIDGADQTGAVGVDAFGTGMISQEMYYYLEDMKEAKGFSEGFEETGKYVESNIMGSIIKKMVLYRWVMLATSLGVGMAVFSWQFSVIYEMRGAMSSFLATG